jgi:ornithine cyclodeaminase
MLMPAWRKEDIIGVKLVTVFKRNSQIGRPGIAGLYVLFSGSDGRTLATLEGGELTARRTAAASALAADYLARNDASTLLVVGTGRLSLNIPQAYRAIRPIERVLVWGRRADEAVRRAEELSGLGFAAEPVASISEGLISADIVSCATNSTVPLVLGDDVRPGTHVDLIGAFQPTMRESDDALMRKADVIIADTFEGVFEEAGDILQAIDSGAITRDSVAGELADLCNGNHSGRLNNEQVTVFKSCGTALEDLAAAQLALANQN